MAARGVGLGGIGNALEAMGLGKWTAKAVGAALKRLGIKADAFRAAEAVFTPEGEEGTAADYEGVEGWEGHGGEKFIRPWLDRVGHDVRDTGAAGEQGDLGGADVDTSFADRAVEHLERREKADQDNPFKPTA